MTFERTLRNLTEPTERDIGRTFQKIADLLEGAGERAQAQVWILSGDERQCWNVQLDQDSCKVGTDEIRNPDIEIFTQAETWGQIANGVISPGEAALQGKLRFRGDVELARRLFERLASS